MVRDDPRLPPRQQPAAERRDDRQADEDERDVQYRRMRHPFAELAAEQRDCGQVGDGGTEYRRDQPEGAGGRRGDRAAGTAGGSRRGRRPQITGRLGADESDGHRQYREREQDAAARGVVAQRAQRRGLAGGLDVHARGHGRLPVHGLTHDGGGDTALSGFQLDQPLFLVAQPPDQMLQIPAGVGAQPGGGDADRQRQPTAAHRDRSHDRHRCRPLGLPQLTTARVRRRSPAVRGLNLIFVINLS